MAPYKGTIVIIDDDIPLQSMLQITLSKAGYTVATASNGEEGLELLRHVQPTMVISDIMMPTMDGVEMFQRIKERLQDNNIPIIIITALNRKPWFADLEAEGAAILQKPFQLDDLLRLVDVTLL